MENLDQTRGEGVLGKHAAEHPGPPGLTALEAPRTCTTAPTRCQDFESPLSKPFLSSSHSPRSWD
jgi:hypothetical protein